MVRSVSRTNGALHVLVVDDSDLVLEVVREWLEALGHRVSTRNAALGTAADVVSLCPDVMLVDVLMPGIRGDDLARFLKRHPATRSVPIILHSSLEAEELHPLIMTTGALGVIAKTGRQALFSSAFETLVARIRPPSSNSSEPIKEPPPRTSGTYPIDGFSPFARSEATTEVDVSRRRC